MTAFSNRKNNTGILFVAMKICLLVCFAGFPLIHLFAQTNEAINIGNRRELFVDYSIIEKLENTRLELHHPHAEDIALKFDKPWEGFYCSYITVIKDDKIWRMYYRGLPHAENWDDPIAVTCYAESKDGIHWVKPNLGLFNVMGTMDNNVILDRTFFPIVHNFSVFIDTRPGVPAEQKYKGIGGTKKSGLVAFVSADGIHWEKLRNDPVFEKGMFDSQNVAFWSEVENCYALYFRTWTGDEYSGFRTISRTTSKDFLNWTEPVAMDFGDTPMEHLYTNATTPYFRAPHIYLSLPKRFFPNKAAFLEEKAKMLVDNPKYRIASSDAVLMSTRGGNKYDRTFMEGFIRPGDSPNDWVARDNTPALGIYQGNEREVFIFRGSHYAQPTSHVTRYSLRLDGFVSVSASYDGGELLTKPIIFQGNELEVNFETSAAGGLKVEIQNADAPPVPGYSLEECPEMIGNEISRKVIWKNGSDVSELAGRPIRLRFVMKDADLYSFRFK